MIPSMDRLPLEATPVVVTEGGVRLNIIIALGNLKEVFTSITSTINHLGEFVLEDMSNTT